MSAGSFESFLKGHMDGDSAEWMSYTAKITENIIKIKELEIENARLKMESKKLDERMKKLARILDYNLCSSCPEQEWKEIVEIMKEYSPFDERYREMEDIPQAVPERQRKPSHF